MDFDKVGRLQPIQSTRGFGLAGQPYFFQPPIKPKPKKRPRRRAKAGKIIYDNKRAKYFREVEMGLRQRRRPRLHRNTTNASQNPYDHIGRDDSIVRPDGINKEIVIKLEQGLDRRLDREVDEIEDIVAKRIKEHRDRIRVPNEIPLLQDRGLVRAPTIEGGRPIEDDGRVNLQPPKVIEPRIEVVEQSEDSKSQLGVDDPRLLVEVEPTREREGGGRSLRDVPVVSYAESSQSSGDSDFVPSPSKKKGAKSITIEESDFLERQQSLEREAEQRRVLQIRRDKEALAQRDKEESESFRLERGGSGDSKGFDVSGDVNGVADFEREVNREDDSDERKRGFLRRGRDRLKKGLSRPTKEPDTEPVFVAPQNNPIDNPMLGVGGILYNRRVENPLNAPSVATTELSSDITTDALDRVLAGDRATDIDQQTTIPADSEVEFALD
jgi:hypothetical protein